jgi:type I restriction enzyme, S subunit
LSTEKVELRELCTLITKGTTPTSIGFDFADNGVGFLRVQNVSGGQVNHLRDTLFIAPAVHTELRRSQIAPGDILLSIAGTIGRTGVVPNDAPPLNCNQALAIIRTTDKVFRPYLRHWLESFDAQTQMRGSAVTGTIQNLSLAQVGSLKVPTPPLSEQRRIAAILDQADALRAKRREALAQLDSLTQSIFIEMFGDPVSNSKRWKVSKLGDLVTKLGSGSTPTGGDAAYKESGISLIRSLNVHDGEFVYKNLAFIDEVQAGKLSNVVVEEGDVLLNITGASVARVCSVPDKVLPARVNQHVMIIRPTSKLNRIYLERLLLNPQMKTRLLQVGGAGATREAITKAQAEELLIPMPPMEMQIQFANRVSQVRGLISRGNQSLSELNALFASLQNRAFAGEL